METQIVDCHRKKAYDVFQEAIRLAETKLMRESSYDSIEEAMVMIDLAELHLLSNETGKAEIEFTKALNYFLRHLTKDEPIFVSYIVYLLKSLSGIHECQGRKNEAKTELSDAEKWEEKLMDVH